jgi:hypothetical protein
VIGRRQPSPTALPPAWASVRLIDGKSSANYWRVDSGTPQAQLAVGSGERCEWRVAAGGVAPVHFQLVWDGHRLWIGDTERAGGVTVDGAVLGGAWQPLPGRARVEFGRAVMLAESSIPAVSVGEEGEQGGGAGGVELPAHEQPTLIAEAPGAAPTLILPAGARPPLLQPFLQPVVGRRRGAFSLPLRTWLLIAVTCAALSAVLLMDGGGAVEPAAKATRRAASTRGTATVTSDRTPSPDPDPIPNPNPNPDPSPDPNPDPNPDPDPDPDPERDRDRDRDPDPERDRERDRDRNRDPDPDRTARDSGSSASGASARLAAELLAAGRQREALAVYDELARNRPDDPVFAAIVAILERRLAARCRNEDPGRSSPCPDRP